MFALEIENWVEYELVKDFSNADRAKAYGLQSFPQNKWRVVDRRGGAVVYDHDPFAVMAAEAALELQRFKETERWRRHFADQAAAEVRQRQERERLQERQRRLRGFHFVGANPWDDYFDAFPERRNPLEEKVNWLKEGF